MGGIAVACPECGKEVRNLKNHYYFKHAEKLQEDPKKRMERLQAELASAEEATGEEKPLLSTRARMELDRSLEKVIRQTEERTVVVDRNKPGVKLDRFSPAARKVPFSMEWFKKTYPLVTFIPEATVPVTINGVMVMFEEGKETTVPQPFKGEYDRWRAQLRRPHFRSEPKDGAIWEHRGAGALPPESEEQ